MFHAGPINGYGVDVELLGGLCTHTSNSPNRMRLLLFSLVCSLISSLESHDRSVEMLSAARPKYKYLTVLIISARENTRIN
jgi:hypothetical protein